MTSTIAFRTSGTATAATFARISSTAAPIARAKQNLTRKLGDEPACCGFQHP
jgi:hypothetical protein